MGRYNLSTIEKWTEHVADLHKESRYLGDSWVVNPFLCRQYRVTPPPSQQFDFKGSATTKTSFPILFAANTRDPVTPLANAQKMRDVFLGSALLVQASSGHTSNNESSNCIRAAFLDYFNKRTLPKLLNPSLPNVQPFSSAA